MELWDASYLDMMEPAYILFDDKVGGEFAFGCVTGHIHNRAADKSADFTWKGNDEMDETAGDGCAELQEDGSLKGEIRFHNGDESAFIAQPWPTSSTAI